MESSDDHELIAEIFPVPIKKNKRDKVSIVKHQHNYYMLGTY